MTEVRKPSGVGRDFMLGDDSCELLKLWGDSRSGIQSLTYYPAATFNLAEISGEEMVDVEDV